MGEITYHENKSIKKKKKTKQLLSTTRTVISSSLIEQELSSTIYKIDNQQRPTVYQRELCSIFCDNPYEKRI